MIRPFLATVRDIFVGGCGWLVIQIFGSEHSLVLAYHSISDVDWIHAVPASVFAKQLRWLKTHLDVVSLSDLEWRRSERRRRRRMMVALTFDDGYDDWMQTAAPLLRGSSLPATFFVTSNFLILTNAQYAGLEAIHWEDIRKLSDMGFEIGSHGHTHTPFPECSEIKLLEECTESQRILSEIGGKLVVRLSYPKNRSVATAIPLLKKLRYISAYDGDGAVSVTSSLWEMPRLTITRNLSFLRFRCRIYAACAFSRL